MGRSVISLGMLLVLCGVDSRADVGRVDAAGVATLVAAMKADELAADQGEQILLAASRARVGQPSLGMKGVPLVGGGKIKAALKSTAKQIVQPARSCAVTLRGKVAAIAKRRR